MRFTKVIISLLLCLAAYSGDYIVFKSKYSNSQLFRAISDSLVHATIGFLSSLLFLTSDISLSNYAYGCNVLFCTFLSSFIDVDHAIAAKSIYFKDMTNLKQRGIFHCTTFWLAITLLLLLYSYIAKKLNIYLLTFMIIVAFSSHHIRDGNRRGLWFYPFGSTPAINKHLYVFLITILPILYGYLYKSMESRMYRHSVVNFGYKSIV